MSPKPNAKALPFHSPVQPGPSMRPRLCFLAYRQIRLMATPILAEYASRADIEVIDGSFEVALRLAQERVDNGLTDVFVSAGSNASLLRAGLSAPVATIKLGGFDILQALIRARQLSDCVGIVMYGQTLPELESVKTLLNVDIRQYAYTTPEVARQCIGQLSSGGVKVVVGSSLVVELAQNAGLTGVLAYSLESIRQGFEDALELARAARREAGRYEQLNSVLHTLHDAVLAVSREGQVIAANPAMQDILGRRSLVGTSLDDLPAELSMRTPLQHSVKEHDGVLRIHGRDWLARRSPILEHGAVTGATLTLYDPRHIHEADNTLRIQKRSRQNATRYSFDHLLGQAPALVQTVQIAKRYAGTGLGVLITGESGVGKELFAQAIHQEGGGATRPFVAVNCAAFPESLLESELFGYEEGAFTGARRGGKRGLFEAAHTGTIFLDEIGDMPLTLQSRLLRVLQEREVTRLGGTAAIPIEVRVIAATHRDLLARVANGQFRQDLFYRLNTLRLALPALRERSADIFPLSLDMLQRHLWRMRSRLDAQKALLPLRPLLEAHQWPGNVRELENIIGRIAAYLVQFPSDDTVNYTSLRTECPEIFHEPSGNHETSLPSLPTNAERARQALLANGGKHTQAARQLGVSRSTLWRWRQPD